MTALKRTCSLRSRSALARLDLRAEGDERVELEGLAASTTRAKLNKVNTKKLKTKTLRAKPLKSKNAVQGSFISPLSPACIGHRKACLYQDGVAILYK